MDVDRDWDPQVRREIRRDLRHIIQDVQEHRDEITRPDELVERVYAINHVFEGVVATREAAIDAEGFQLISAVGKEQAECSAGELVFDPVVFAEKLVTFMGGRRGDGGKRELNWAKLGEKAASIFQEPPHLSFMYGALDLAPLIKKKKQKTARSKSSVKETATKPKELSHFEEEEESTTKDVAHIFKHLKLACEEGKRRVHYFRFLVDPDSFAHTVENMFHFSFLIKDGRAGIMIDSNDHQPYIHLPECGAQSTKQTKNQAIISINIPQWKKAIEKFGIVAAQILPRQD